MKSKNTNKVRVLIPDGESHLTIYVINCLQHSENIDLYILSSIKYNPVRYSNRVKKFIYYNSSTDKLWIQKVKTISKEYAIDLIFPVFELRIQTIIKFHDKINANEIVWLPDLTNFNTAIDKWLLAHHCNKLGILYPKTVLFQKNDKAQLQNISYPCIVKPRSGYGGGQGVKIIENKDALIKHITENTYKSDILIQDYVEGYDIDCSVLCHEGEVTAYTIQKGTLFGASPFQPQLRLIFLEEDRILEIVKKLMKSLNWSGLAHLDCRYDKNSDSFYIIEINARIWVSLDASCLAGVNFPQLLIEQSNSQEDIQRGTSGFTYLNLKGIIRTLRSSNRGVLSINFLKHHTQLVFVMRDIKPYIYKFIKRTKNILFRRKTKKI